MTDLFCYSLLSSIVLTVLWGAYGLCLKGERFHDLNRMALWSIMFRSQCLCSRPSRSSVTRSLRATPE